MKFLSPEVALFLCQSAIRPCPHKNIVRSVDIYVKLINCPRNLKFIINVNVTKWITVLSK